MALATAATAWQESGVARVAWQQHLAGSSSGGDPTAHHQQQHILSLCEWPHTICALCCTKQRHDSTSLTSVPHDHSPNTPTPRTTQHNTTGARPRGDTTPLPQRALNLDLSPQQLLLLMDHLACLEATWHNGGALARTLYSSLYMMQPDRFVLCWCVWGCGLVRCVRDGCCEV